MPRPPLGIHAEKWRLLPTKNRVNASPSPPSHGKKGDCSEHKQSEYFALARSPLTLSPIYPENPLNFVDR